MAGTLRPLPPIAIPGHEITQSAGSDHPMRVMTRRAAGLVPDQPWDDEARAAVAALFDGLAADWHTRATPERVAIVEDALARGLPEGAPRRVCVELGSGIGTYTPVLQGTWDRVLATELALEMLHRAPTDVGHRLLADGAALPLADGAADAVVLVNCFLFPHEVERVLGPDGVVVWVNSSGSHTPIHLTPAEVAEALPGRWDGVHSTAGEGLWAVLQRAGR